MYHDLSRNHDCIIYKYIRVAGIRVRCHVQYFCVLYIMCHVIHVYYCMYLFYRYGTVLDTVSGLCELRCTRQVLLRTGILVEQEFKSFVNQTWW